MLRRSLLVGLILCLFSSSLVTHADVIANEPEESSAAAAKVTGTLAKLGVEQRTAEAVVADLTPSELAYFADSPNAAAVVGALWLEEWIGGVIVFLGVTFVTVSIIQDRRD